MVVHPGTISWRPAAGLKIEECIWGWAHVLGPACCLLQPNYTHRNVNVKLSWLTGWITGHKRKLRLERGLVQTGRVTLTLFVFSTGRNTLQTHCTKTSGCLNLWDIFTSLLFLWSVFFIKCNWIFVLVSWCYLWPSLIIYQNSNRQCLYQVHFPKPAHSKSLLWTFWVYVQCAFESVRCVYMWMVTHCQSPASVKLPRSLTAWLEKYHKMKMFPACINENQRKKNLHEHTWYFNWGIIHTAHTSPEKICMTLSHRFAHSPLPSPFSLLPPYPPAPSCLPHSEQMEVSVDFQLYPSQGGATGLICMFWSEVLSVWVTEVSLLTQLRSLTARRGQG